MKAEGEEYKCPRAAADLATSRLGNRQTNALGSRLLPGQRVLPPLLSLHDPLCSPKYAAIARCEQPEANGRWISCPLRCSPAPRYRCQFQHAARSTTVGLVETQTHERDHTMGPRTRLLDNSCQKAAIATLALCNGSLEAEQRWTSLEIDPQEFPRHHVFSKSVEYELALEVQVLITPSRRISEPCINERKPVQC